MANIILAHGFLGVGELPFGWESNYFRNVATLYRQLGHKVLIPTVDAIGSLTERSIQLRDTILQKWPDQDQLIVIGHSMGGLDIRRAVAHSPEFAKRVQRIIAIATPHFGSPVANAVLDPTHELQPYIPSWLREALHRHAGAIEDLRTRSTLHDEDVPNILYTEIACDSSSLPQDSPLFRLTQAIGRLTHEANDGVVTLSSAKIPQRPLHQVWSTDHCGAIGWPTGNYFLETLTSFFTHPTAHLERYRQLVSTT
jgi:triacylglycerol lipase